MGRVLYSAMIQTINEVNKLQEQKRINSVLEKECRHLKKVISKCIPVHTIIFLLINMAVISAVSVLLTLRFFMNVYIIDAYYLLCLLLASATLFCTALKSLSEWRKFLHGLSERKEK